LLVYLALVVITFATYWQVFQLGLTNYDDDHYVGQNLRVQSGLTWDGIKWAFTTAEFTYWHPLAYVSHMLDCELFGMKIGGHHFINLLIHVVNSCLLFALFWRMTKDFWPAAFLAALFALHPLRVESVVWIAERKDVLSTFFYLLSILAYIRYTEQPSRRWYAFALVAFAAALATKPMIVSLPCALLLLDFWPLRRLALPNWRRLADRSFWVEPASQSLRQILLEKVPFVVMAGLATAAGVIIVRITGMHGGSELFPIPLRLANTPISFARYLGKMLWPDNLAVLYPMPSHWPLWQVLASILLLILLSWVIVKQADRKPYLLFGWLWFLVTLLPVIGVITFSWHSIADRYTYIPSVGVFAMVIWLIKELSPAGRAARPALASGAALILAACVGKTWTQIPHWRDTKTLFTQAVRVTKNNAIAHYNVGRVFVLEKNWAAAAEQFRAAVQINPKYDVAQTSLGGTLLELGQRPEAIEHLNAALRANPNQDNAHFNLALALAASGNHAAAGEHFAAVTRLVPTMANAHAGLSVSLARQGKTREAIQSCRDGLVLCPNTPDLLNNLSWLLATSPADELRNGEEATQLAAQACELTQYQRAELVCTLAAAHAEAGRFSQATSAATMAHDSAHASGDAAVTSKCLRMLELFRANKPYRETPSSP
jgi:tetratricopeptide (TPR) repeat protein